MKTQLSIQERLKDLRVEKGMTLEQLSQQTKMIGGFSTLRIGDETLRRGLFLFSA